jgi:hypothetical protein
MPHQDTEAKGTTLREFATRFAEACGQAREQNWPARTRRLPDRDGAQALLWNTVRRFLLRDRDLFCGGHSEA